MAWGLRCRCYYHRDNLRWSVARIINETERLVHRGQWQVVSHLNTIFLRGCIQRPLWPLYAMRVGKSISKLELILNVENCGSEDNRVCFMWLTRFSRTAHKGAQLRPQVASEIEQFRTRKTKLSTPILIMIRAKLATKELSLRGAAHTPPEHAAGFIYSLRLF